MRDYKEKILAQIETLTSEQLKQVSELIAILKKGRQIVSPGKNQRVVLEDIYAE